MTDVTSLTMRLSRDARSVGAARRQLRAAVEAHGLADADVEGAELALSEVVTNAIVHTGDEVSVQLWVSSRGIRVEVQDNSPHVPVRRHYAGTAGTGRGLQLLEDVTDRWGTSRSELGKTVWFEIGSVAPNSDHPNSDHPDDEDADNAGASSATAVSGVSEDLLAVTLRRAPLLMHWAWQEHAAALLREYLLHVLDEDDSILDRHAEASEAMSLLHEQLLAPQLPDDPDGLMAGALEPHVTAEEIVLHIPRGSVPCFATLDDLLSRATQQAHAGRFLGPPTQPEIEEMREWICAEVAKQTSGQVTATPWLARTDIRKTLADRIELAATYAPLGQNERPVLATNEASIIVAVSPAALELLGYKDPEDLLGRRVLVVVPDRFHQAHIAGTTLNATNGRDVLLGVPLLVPMVRADGSEVQVSIEVRPEKLDQEHRVFVAHFESA
jgi:PAS domain S-box-containing protein